ncbi:glycosyltransferase [Mesorhizobium sp. M1406]|uniref:glycosyltransferase n=1 Tax=Mesorhizobium sp. M1406 TaxID=2957099 RepID=UPI00333CFAD7
MFNVEQNIGAMHAGIRRQTYQMLDIVVVDDGSNGSASIVTAYADKDQRILFYRRTRHG